MGRWLEQICERYLARRERIVLSVYFNGIVLGNATAVEESPDVWSVITYPGSRIIILNNSIVQMSTEPRQ